MADDGLRAIDQDMAVYVRSARAVLDKIPAMIAYWDKHQRCRFANRAYQIWFGISPEDLIGKTMCELLGPIYLLNLPYIEGVLSGKAQEFEREIPDPAGGPSRHSHAFYTPDIIDGVVAGFVVLVADVSQRKLLENTLRDAKEQADAALRSRSEFLARISHEIRTPMNAVLGQLELLSFSDLKPEQRELLAGARNSALGLLGLINDILDFSKIDAGKLSLETVGLSLRTCVDAAVYGLSMIAAKKGIALQTIVSPEVPDALLGDPLRLRQILINLVSNALKFTNTGTVLLSISVLQVSEVTARLRFSVRDTGIGIPKDKLGAIFQAFSQADGSIARKFGGTGLGLVISAQLVTMMGGKLLVESEEGRGSEFWFELQFPRLPRASATALPQAASAAEAVPDVAWQRQLRILVAEDNEVNQLVVAGLLNKLGHIVSIVSDGEAALAAVALHNYDMVLMDVQMPILDGIQAIRKIRKHERGLEHLPIVALTAQAMSGDREEILRAGADDYISKPFSLAELKATIDNVMRPSSGSRHERAPLAYDRDDFLRRVDYDEKLLRSMVAAFLSQLPNERRHLEEAIGARDCESVARIAHHLRGALANVGATRAVRQVAQLELDALAGNIDEAANLFRTLNSDLNQLEHDFRIAGDVS